MNMKNILRIAAAFLVAAVSASCMKADFGGMTDEGIFADGAASKREPGGDGDGNGNGNTNAGVLTAAEWCDLDHWDFWSGLMESETFAGYASTWGFHTNNRVAVQLTDKGMAVANVAVTLKRGNKTIWQARTDNHGKANCWIGLNQKEAVEDTSALSLTIGSTPMKERVKVTGWDPQAAPAVNEFEYSPTKAAAMNADIAFIVDATGSMGDEISFLKSDLKDIINKVSSMKTNITIRTAALFYRDEGDEYVTRESNFTSNFSKTGAFIGEQNANGGGDYPEAVHTALENGIQKLSWDENAFSRIAFLILDAPAHNNTAVKQSIQDSIELYAKMGIRLIPVAASGVDKSTEFMCRFFATVTGGTYTFLTNDSGVGGDHIEASVGEYQVEQLNELIVRLITSCID